MRPEQNRKYFTIALYALIVLLIGIAAVFCFWKFDAVASFFALVSDVCAPVVYGALIAYLLNPLLKIFEKKVLKPKNAQTTLSHTARRILAVTMTFISFFILIALFIWMILPQLTASIKDLGEKFPSYLQSVEDLAHSIAEGGGAIADAIESLLTTINEFIDNSYTLLKQYLPQLTETLQSLALGALDIILGIVFAIYFLYSKEHIAATCKKLLRALTKEDAYNNILRVLSLSNNTFGKYFTGAILDSMLVGVICFVLMTILRMPYAPLISVVIGITNVIPFFGPFIGAIPSAIILFVANPIFAVYFAVMILVLQQIDGNIIAPRIHSASTGLDPVWVIISITVMSGLFGFVGMLIGVPLFSVIYTLVKEQVEKRLENKNQPTATSNYMSELGRAYSYPEKPEKETRPIKEVLHTMLEKARPKRKGSAEEHATDESPAEEKRSFKEAFSSLIKGIGSFFRSLLSKTKKKEEKKPQSKTTGKKKKKK